MLQDCPATWRLEALDAQREPSVSPTARLLGDPDPHRAAHAFAQPAAEGRPLLCGLSLRPVLGVALAVVPVAAGIAAAVVQHSAQSRQRGVNHDCYASYRGAA